MSPSLLVVAHALYSLWSHRVFVVLSLISCSLPLPKVRKYSRVHPFAHYHVRSSWVHVLLGVVRFMQIAYLRLSLTIRLVNLLTRQRWLTDGIWTLLLTVSYSSTPEAQLMDSLITHRLLMFPYQDGRNKWLHNINLYARPAHGNTLSGVCST